MIGKYIDRLVKKNWSDDQISNYIGDFKHCYLTYASCTSIRQKAASGGTTSAMLIHGLQAGLFEGVVVCNTKVTNNKVRVHFSIAVNREEVLAARGSKYVQSKFLQDVLPLIHAFSGRVAVVGLPCDISALKRIAGRDKTLNNKIALTIALVCGHNSRKELIDQVTNKLAKEAGQSIIDYRFRVGHWRGRLEADLANGKMISKPSKYFNDYQNLFFFSERKCMACHDHYGYAADISVGDIWLFRLKHESIKRTAIITRTHSGQQLYDSVVYANQIVSEDLDIKDVLDGQSRIGPAHYNVSARVKAGRLFKVKLKDNVKTHVSWHEWINALLTIANIKLSESQIGKSIIFSTPRSVLKCYLYFKKGLESIK